MHKGRLKTLKIRFSDDLFVFAFHHPSKTNLPFFIGSLLGKRRGLGFQTTPVSVYLKENRCYRSAVC